MSTHPNDLLNTGTTTGTSHTQNLLGILCELFEKYMRSRQLRKSQRDARTAFLPMLRIDDQILDDIGVTREEVRWAANLPLEINAGKALQARAREREAEAMEASLSSQRRRIKNRDVAAKSVIAQHQASTHR